MEIYQKLKDDVGQVEILSLPILVYQGCSIFDVVSGKLSNYLYVVRKLLNNGEYDREFHYRMSSIVNGLIEVFMLISDCKFDIAYNRLKTHPFIMDIIKPFIISSLPNVYYRARKGMFDKAKELFHVPSTKNYLCQSFRFSESGYPALYLSASKEGCKVEIPGKATIAKFLLRNVEKTFHFLDLTFLNLQNNELNVTKNQKELHLMWPIIACCYILTHWDSNNQRQDNAIRFYKEEYIFPQLLSRFLRETALVDGIKYFTVRDELLDPSNDDKTDYVFFTKQYDKNGLDEILSSKFDINILIDK